jgi:kynurenine formamidase
VFDLGIPLDEDGPQIGGGRTNPTRVMSVLGGVAADYGAQRYNDDYVFMPLQAATQWDALSHVYYDDVLFNGFPSSSVDRHGAHKLGIETQSKGITGRGVLLDVAAHLEVDWLAADHVITPEQLDEVARHQGVEVGAGDIALIRTGWRRKFVQEGDGRAFLAEEPGIGLECCAWLRDHDVAAVASDNWAVEVATSTPLPRRHVQHLRAARIRRDGGRRFADDPEWQHVVTSTNEAHGPMVAATHSTLLRPMDFSPLR